MKKLLKEIADKSSGFVELRYHKRTTNSFEVQKGRVDVSNHAKIEGVGVRTLVDGSWGFASTSNLTQDGIKNAIEEARRNAKVLSGNGNDLRLARGDLSQDDYEGPGVDKLRKMPLEEKLRNVINYENELKSKSSKITTAACRYKELIEEKAIVTSDGACASLTLAQPEVRVSAIAEDRGERIVYGKSAGVSGDWSCLYKHPALNNMIDDTAKTAVDLLKAKYAEGGKKTVILAPAVVGMLCHEAIGHTVEADFVRAGSVAQGKIGTRVGSDLVNMADSGCETIAGYATGNIPFDDEGVKTQTTTIIEKGILKSYLHNRETAHEFGVTPTGNARAWLYYNEPLIRMRNTYFLPGTSSLEKMIAEIDDGYLVEGASSGQADANGEFMFGCSYVWRIQNGKKVQLLREATLSGIAFDVLQTVDAVSKEFLWDLGSGYCGKGQPAKVDAGGPYVRCKIHVGGR
ncbi:MAG: TldD/PmbA family protein [Oligoflexales bacterium]